MPRHDSRSVKAHWQLPARGTPSEGRRSGRACNVDVVVQLGGGLQVVLSH